MACGLFGISSDVAMQAIAISFVIGVLPDSTETTLKSSSDGLLKAAACPEAITAARRRIRRRARRRAEHGRAEEAAGSTEPTPAQACQLRDGAR